MGTANRIGRCVGLVLSAGLASAACTGGGAPTGLANTSLPPTATSSWAGSARFTTASTQPGATSTESFEGAVTWQKDNNPDPALPLRAGAVRYRISSGQMRVTYQATRSFQFPPSTCSDQGTGSVTLVPNDPPDEPFLQSYVDLGEDGQYTGFLYKKSTVTISGLCSSGSVQSFSGELTMGLRIKGSLTSDRRMRGDMEPEMIAGETNTGSWDFAGQ